MLVCCVRRLGREFQRQPDIGLNQQFGCFPTAVVGPTAVAIVQAKRALPPWPLPCWS